MLISDLERFSSYGSEPETVSQHFWVKIFEEATASGYFTLIACKNCGSLARRRNSPSWEFCRPNGSQWILDDSTTQHCDNSLWV